MNDLVIALQITVLGMVTVFCILVLLSVAMHFMSRLVGRMAEAEVRPAPARSESQAPARTEPGPEPASSADQEELIAVLAASVAAYKQISGTSKPQRSSRE
jgi:sodium pump decarboxylase gamma subunit